MSAVSNDDVIQQFNADQLSTLGEPSRELDVLAAWPGISSRVIVNKNDAASAYGDRGLEDFSWMHEIREHRHLMSRVVD
jgi:hypothetical protein